MVLCSLLTAGLRAKTSQKSTSRGEKDGADLAKVLSWRRIPLSGPGDGKTEEIRQLLLGPANGLWVLTARGLGRLDSESTYGPRGASAIRSDRVFAMATHPYGLVAATRDGLFALRDVPSALTEEPLSLMPGLFHSVVSNGEQVFYLKREPGGQSVLGSLRLSASGKIKNRLQEEQQAPLREILHLGNGRLLLQSQAREWRLALSGSWKQTLLVRSADEPTELLAVAADLGLTSSGLIQVNDDASIKEVYPLDDVGGGAIARGRDGASVLVAQGKQIARLIKKPDGTLDLTATYPGPSGQPLKVLAEDDAGLLWAGTDEGLYVADPVRGRPVSLGPQRRSPLLERAVAGSRTGKDTGFSVLASEAARGSAGQSEWSNDSASRSHNEDSLSFTSGGDLLLLTRQGKAAVITEEQHRQDVSFPGEIFGARINYTLLAEPELVASTDAGVVKLDPSRPDPLHVYYRPDAVSSRRILTEMQDMRQLASALISKPQAMQWFRTFFRQKDPRIRSLPANQVDAAVIERLHSLEAEKALSKPLVLEEVIEEGPLSQGRPVARDTRAASKRPDSSSPEWPRPDAMIKWINPRWPPAAPFSILAANSDAAILRSLENQQVLLLPLRELAMAKPGTNDSIIQEFPLDPRQLPEKAMGCVGDMKFQDVVFASESLDSVPLFLARPPEYRLSSLATPAGQETIKIWSVMSSDMPSGSASVLMKLGDSAGGSIGVWQRAGSTGQEWRELFKGPASSEFLGQVNGLIPEKDGSLTAAMTGPAESAVVKIKGSAVHVLLSASRGSSYDSALIRDREGRLWIGTDAGLYRETEPGKFERVPVLGRAATELTIGSIAEDSQKRIWVLNHRRSGLWMLRPGKTELEPVLDFGLNRALILRTDPRTGHLWIGGTGVLRWIEAGTLRAHDLWDELGLLFPDHARDQVILGLLPRQEDTLLLTKWGLARYSQSGFEQVDAERWPAQPVRAGRILLRRDGSELLFARHEESGPFRIWSRRAGQKSFSYVRTLSLYDGINSVAETADGQILIGSWQGRVLRLRGDLEIASSFSALPVSGDQKPKGMILSHCFGWLDRLLILTERGLLHWIHFDSEPTRVVPLQANVEPFVGCAIGSTNEIFLLYPGQITAMQLSGGRATLRTVAIEGRPPRNLEELFWTTPTDPKTLQAEVLLLADGNVYQLDRQRGSFVQIATIPEKLRVHDRWRQMTTDTDSLYVPTESAGLWRLPIATQGKPPQPAQLEQIASELSGLPSNDVHALSMIAPGQHVIVTERGFAELRRGGSSGAWEVRRIPESGILGKEVRLAALGYLSAERNRPSADSADSYVAVALATEQGVTVAAWPRSAGAEILQKARWAHVNADSGLPDRDVQVVRWSTQGDRNELWIGTPTGVSVFEVSLSEGQRPGLELKLVFSLGSADGLPAGRVLDIQLDPKGENAWFLSEISAWTEGDASLQKKSYRVSRYRRAEGGPRAAGPELPGLASGRRRIAVMAPLLLEGVRTVKLGPSVGDRPPKLLVQDAAGDRSLLELSDMLSPRLEVDDRFFFLAARLDPGSLDPRQDQLEGWQVRYGVDHLASPQILPFVFPPDLWKPRAYHVLAEMIRKTHDNERVRLVVSLRIPPTHPGWWFARLIVLALTVLGPLTYLVVTLIRRVRRRRMIRAEIIPYIEGEAISDPRQFFGRGELLTLVRDTLANTNYALIGDFRIGKTSIQHQLTRLLRETQHDRYVFFPVFIDFQDLGKGRSDRFFYFLGEQMIQQITRNYHVEESELRELRIHRYHDPARIAAYSSIHFKADVIALLAVLKRQVSPQEPRIVLQLDEVNLIATLSPDIRHGLRSVLVNEPGLKAVLTGSLLPRDEDDDKLSPWWNIFKEVEVLPLRPSEARTLIVEPVRGLFVYEEEAIEELIARSEGKPLLLQALCVATLRYKYRTRSFRKRITRFDVEEAARTSTLRPGMELARSTLPRPCAAMAEQLQERP